VILVDSSAWIDYLRATGSPVHLYLRQLVRGNQSLATTEVIVMEVLAGARDDAHLRALSRLMERCDLVPAGDLSAYQEAAAMYRVCRRHGETIRRLTDCLIAATAIRARLSILHRDRDFDALARHTALQIEIVPHAS
jgi:predicted nucleic acid-binding protein